MSREMRHSGIEWIGEIPKEWKVNKIGNLYHVRNEKVSDKDFPPLSVTMNGLVPRRAEGLQEERDLRICNW